VITSSIDGVVVKELTVHADDRGYLLEVVRDDDRVFHEVKQTTFTVAYPGVIKAFHWHRKHRLCRLEASDRSIQGEDHQRDRLPGRQRDRPRG